MKVQSRSSQNLKNALAIAFARAIGAISVVTAIGVAASLAHAQTQTKSASAPPSNSKSSDQKQPSKKTTVNFEDQLIEGQTQKPELFYLLQQRNNNFKRLIKLRENFLPEMRKTSEEISRKGSGI